MSAQLGALRWLMGVVVVGMLGVGHARQPVVAPVGSHGHWAAEWWQWALDWAPGEDPVSDPDGSKCAEGQSGPVWFLAGNWGGETVRHCTIPRGKRLFFPLINYVWVTTCEGEPNTRRALLAEVAPYVDPADNLMLTVDGVEVPNIESYRAQSPLFCTSLEAWGWDYEALEAACPEWYGEGVQPVTCPNNGGGEFGPALTDGYWIMLNALSPGRHTLRFTARNPVTGFELDVTYHLRIR